MKTIYVKRFRPTPSKDIVTLEDLFIYKLITSEPGETEAKYDEDLESVYKDDEFTVYYHNDGDDTSIVSDMESDGYNKVRPSELNVVHARMYANKLADRYKKGYVILRHGDLSKDSLKGGFSDELFNSVQIQQYLKGDLRDKGGYLLYIDRRYEIDTYLENTLLANGVSRFNMDRILVSSFGREIAEIIYTSEDIEVIKENIGANLERIMKLLTVMLSLRSV